MNIVFIIILICIIFFPSFFEIDGEITINGKDVSKHLYYILIILTLLAILF